MVQGYIIIIIIIITYICFLYKASCKFIEFCLNF